jgi:uncharacterized protein YneF (UPF0154 family)
MVVLDRLYVIIYWSVNRNLIKGRTTIWTLNYLLFPILSGCLVFILSLIFWLLSIKISLPIIILIGVISSFFLSEKLVEKYYTENKQNEIIAFYPKPGFYRYFTFAFIVISVIIFMLLFFFLAGIFYNRPTLH